MSVKIQVNIDPAAIQASRGLGSSDKVQVFIAENVARLCDPYVPMSAGAGAHMKEQYTIAPDGSSITYHGPYAHFQYVGEVMVGVMSGSPWAMSGEPKRYTGRPLDYHGGPMRGKGWDKRMLADRGDELVAAVADYIGGIVK